ncbi:MAG: hypothetical protein II781_03410 [Clostridia bacterium]|nr:hypothetical protein [Clostridia bacterium]
MLSSDVNIRKQQNLRIRVLSFVLVLCMLVPALSGCGNLQDHTGLVSEFFQAVSNGNYGAAYACLSSASKAQISSADFTNKYTNILDALAADEPAPFMVEIHPQSSLQYEAVITYSSAPLGSFIQTVRIPLLEDTDGEIRIDWSPACIFEDLSWDDTVSLRVLRCKRGEILGEDATQYAVNSYADTVYVNLDDLEALEVADAEKVKSDLCFLCDVKEEDLKKILESKRAVTDRIALIQTYWPGEMSDMVRKELRILPSVGIDNGQYTPIRYYPQKNMLSHLLGYATGVTKEDLEKDRNGMYTNASLIGRNGLEASYEELLTGQDGYALDIYNKDGSRKGNVYTKPAQNGLDLALTIDYDLQTRAENALATLPDRQGAVILTMDPTTGAVTSIASNPDYDPNAFAKGMTQEEYDALLNDTANRPLYNRATQGLYPPGSTLKPLMAAMALENNVLTPADVFRGKIENRQWIPEGDWTYGPITRAQDYAGPVNMRNAIIYSDNIYFANLSLKSGWDLVESFMKNLGFGSTFSFDVGIARSSIYNQEKNKNPRLLADTGYGQGEVLITPLQMASLYTAFVNDGDVLSPYVVSAIKQTDGLNYKTISEFGRKVAREKVIDTSSIDTLLPMLRGVVTDGSARTIQIGNLEIRAKTGTAEIGNDKRREIAWIIAFVEEPYSRLVCVMVEVDAGQGQVRYDLCKEMIAP